MMDKRRYVKKDKIYKVTGTMEAKRYFGIPDDFLTGNEVINLIDKINRQIETEALKLMDKTADHISECMLWIAYRENEIYIFCEGNEVTLKEVEEA